MDRMTALGLYLAMLAGSDRTGYIEGRWRRPGGMGQVFIRTDRLDQLAETAAGMGSRTDFYVGCAPRSHRHGGAEAVPAVYALWADLDGPEAVAALQDFQPAPTVEVASGSGGNRHAYWQLDRPLETADARRALRRLAHALGGDMRSAEPARILRPPGTLNHKTDPPASVECVALDVTAYDPRAVVGDLPDPSDSRAREDRASGPVRPLRAVTDPLASIDPPTYIAALTGREVGRDGKTACPFHDDRTPSLHAYPTVERGWCCHAGCGGGTIIDFGAKLYGLEPRGAGYHEIRHRLEADLRARAAA
jgi:hypothetical protein